MPKFVQTTDRLLRFPVISEGAFDDWGYCLIADSAFTADDSRINPATVLDRSIPGSYYKLLEFDTSIISTAIVTPYRAQIILMNVDGAHFAVGHLPLDEEPTLENLSTFYLMNYLTYTYTAADGQNYYRYLYWAAVESSANIGGVELHDVIFWVDPAPVYRATKTSLGLGQWTVTSTDSGLLPIRDAVMNWPVDILLSQGPKSFEFSGCVPGSGAAYVRLDYFEGIIGSSYSGVPIDYDGGYSVAVPGTADNFNWGTINIGDPGLPADGLLTCGLVALFHPTNAELSALASYLNSSSFFDSLKKTWSDPLESIISLYLLPVEPDATTDRVLVLGGVTTGIEMPQVINTRYKEVDFGTLNIDERFSGFLDYGGRSKLQIHLPYIGFKELPADMWMGSKIGLTLAIDLFTGSGLYNLRCIKGNTIIREEYPVNMASQVPITSTNYMNMYNSLINVASSAMQGSFAGFASALGKQIDSHVSGSAGSTAGSMGSMYAWVSLDCMDQVLPKTYDEEYGRPLESYYPLKNLHGFTTATINIEQISGLTDYERAEIARLLEKGVYL